VFRLILFKNMDRRRRNIKMNNFIKEAAMVYPSERQLAWQQMEFYAFIHFTVNTFTDKEWGHGDEDPEIFNPTEFNADQWVEVCKSAGMKGLVLTCKHHDGFCLWPSSYTEHSVKNSPWKNGKGDIVREVSEACKRGGIKFGVYLSPWDRHEKTYGDSEVYNEYFRKQLRELLTNYGDIFTVWFDGACGEGPNGKRQVYDWDSYYKVIRELQPNAVISVCGPDVRWCGNEAGHCRKSEWSVVPIHLLDQEKIQDKSQKMDDGEFSKKVDTTDEDLGSRKVIENAEKLIWYPAEVNTSIRHGWFYHSSEDDKLKTLDELLNVYYGSVGGNATFLLNLPPDTRGLIHENDAALMKEFGKTIREMFSMNLAEEAKVSVSETMDETHNVNNILNEDRDLFWCPREETELAVIEIALNGSKIFNRIVLMEHIKSGQRVESFKLEYKDGETWRELYDGTTIGYKRICCFDKVTSDRIRFTITNSRWYPTISYMGVYLGQH
jgi:alpha-L-fucosidase